MKKFLNTNFIENRYFPVIFLFLLNLIVFNKYWLGISTPPWDFLGGGMVEQYRFYKDGGFFNPPSWFPYAWFGIPEYQLLQDGGWFLPVAFVSDLFGWHPANAARVQAGLILFGSFGIYLLSSLFVQKRWINALSASLYMFIPAFYSNAQHYGVVRSAALLPWILYFCHPKTILKDRFQILFGGIIVFQSIVGSYPGNLVSTAYTTILFILVFGLLKNPIYLSRILVMGVGGLLMGLIRYLPTFGLQNSFPANVGNQAGVTFYNVIYLIFPFVGDGLPWEDLTLRSLYVGSIVLSIVFFYSYKIVNLNKWSVIVIFSLLMMSEGPLNDLLRNLLPLSNMSRFAITDWRNSFNLAMILVTALILDNLSKPSTRTNLVRFTLFSLTFMFLAYESFKYGQSYLNLIVFSTSLFVSFLVLLKFSNQRFFPISMLIISVLSSLLFVYQNKFAWLTTVKEQNFNIYNNTFTNVHENTFYPLKSRPARVTFLPTPLTPENYKTDQRYNRFWLTGGFGAYGYHNIKDIEAYAALFPRLETLNDPIVNFLLAKSKQVVVKNNQDVQNQIIMCTNSISCANNLDIKIIQTKFDKESESFLIDSPTNFTLIQNEIYSPVWKSRVCANGTCTEIPVEETFESLRTWQLPAGKYTFETRAETPFDKERWILFYTGFVILIISVIIPILKKKRSATI